MNSGKEFTINPSDITIKVLNTTYTCEYLIISKSSSLVTVNGTTKRISYIDSTKSSYKVKKDESSLDFIYCVFLNNPTSSFNLYYKGFLLGLLS